MRRRGLASACLGCLCILLAGSCRPREDTLPTLRRFPLPPQAAGGATLGIDGAGRAWIGQPGRLEVLDTAGRHLRTTATRGEGVPRLLWERAGTLVVRLGQGVLALDSTGAPREGGWSAASLRAFAADPKGRWVYAANRGGGVIGLDAATLRPRWGWAESGRPAVAAAASPYGDRVYISLASGREGGPALQVRDAATGRVLFTEDQEQMITGLAVAPDGDLYGVAGTRVVR